MRRFILAMLLAGTLLALMVGPALAMTIDPPEQSAVQDPCIANPPPTNPGTLIAKAASPAVGGTCP